MTRADQTIAPVHVMTEHNVVRVDDFSVCVPLATLNWEPEHFPRTLATTLGNGEPFELLSVADDCAKYLQCGDSTLSLIVVR